MLIPKRSSQAPTERLTYGMWSTALTGLNNFRLEYPGLFFTYQIYTFPDQETLGEPRGGVCIGWGTFWVINGNEAGSQGLGEDYSLAVA